MKSEQNKNSFYPFFVFFWLFASNWELGTGQQTSIEEMQNGRGKGWVVDSYMRKAGLLYKTGILPPWETNWAPLKLFDQLRATCIVVIKSQNYLSIFFRLLSFFFLFFFFFFQSSLLRFLCQILDAYLTIIPRALMGSGSIAHENEWDWAIDSEAMRARGIIVLVKCN